MAKAVKRSDSTTPLTRKPLSPEAQENLMISLAMDLAEKKLRDGTAPNQLIIELVKRGSTKARIENELLEKQRDLAVARADSLKTNDRFLEICEKAMKAMRRYQGQGDDEEPENDDNY